MTTTRRPTFDTVERRRNELFGVTFFVLVGFAVLSVLLTFVDGPTGWLTQLGGGLNVVRVCLVLLTLAFAWYVRDQQARLRRVANDLVNERVMSAALEDRLRELSALTDIGRAAMSSVDLDEVLEAVLAAAVDLTEADDAWLSVEDGEQGTRTLTTAGAGAIPPADDRDLSVPISLEGEVVGHLHVVRRGSQATLGEREAGIAARLAEQASLSIRNARILVGDRTRGRTAASAARDLESSLATILGTVSVLERGGEAMSSLEREALAAIGRRAEGLVVTAQGLLSEPVERSEPDPIVRRHRRPSRRLKILVADDDPALLRLLGIAVEREGHEVLLAADGVTAIRRFERGSPDVVVVATTLPGADGWAVMERIRREPSPPPIVVVPPDPSPRHRARALEHGADAVLAKPFTADELMDLITQMFSPRGEVAAGADTATG